MKHSVSPLEELEKKLYEDEADKMEPPKIPTIQERLSNKQSVSPPEDLSTKKWLQAEMEEEKLEAAEAVKEQMVFKKISRIGKLVWWSAIIGTLIVLSLAGFYLYQYLTTQDTVLILKTPASVLIGVPFEVEIDFTNGPRAPLKDAKLTVPLPEGVALLGESPNKRFFSKDFGDLESGTSVTEKISLIALDNRRANKQFEMSLSYLPSSLGSRFEKKRSFEVVAKEPAINMDLSAPQKILNAENFEIEVNYQNISAIDFSNTELKLEFPKNFTLKEAAPSPNNNGLWAIAGLPKGASGQTILIKGSVLGAEQTFLDVKGTITIQLAGQKYLINQKITQLNIAASPLTLNIVLNGQQNYLSRTGDNLRYVLTYQNNTDMGLNDAVIKAQLIGEMFDIKRLNTQAFFDSRANTITWNAANTPALRLVPPGESGSAEFSIPAKQEFPIKRLADKNFTLKVKAEISSPTVPYYVAADKTIGLAQLENKIKGYIAIAPKVFFNDPASGGIINKGGLPPKVNVPTEYTIHWIIANYHTDVRNVQVKTYLQSGGRWTGQVKSNVAATPIYNERTQEIVWNIDKIPATKGVIGKPVEAIFQIEATPNITQAGSELPLLSKTELTAFDEFGNVQLNYSTGEVLSTKHLGDIDLAPQNIRVEP